MRKVMDVRSVRTKPIILTILAVSFTIFVILPLSLTAFNGSETGNVALIPVEGVIMGGRSSSFGQSVASSKDITQFIEEANKNPTVKVILLEINSPGGSAVASDEISTAIKTSKKPVVSLIREVGASGGYWIASATESIMANRMSITGSIGVISSYLEFSGLMEKYGIGYEQLIAGDNKDLGSPYKKLTSEEKQIFQTKLDKIHSYFIEEVANNRNLPENKVREVATGEFYLGVEAKNLGLIDNLGDKKAMEEYIKETYGLKKITYANYKVHKGFFSSFKASISSLFFSMGEGIGSSLVKQDNGIII